LKTLIDLDNWPKHFHFFRQFEEPFFGATVQIDCTNAYAKSKALELPFHSTKHGLRSIPMSLFAIDFRGQNTFVIALTVQQ
jgi:hypothetical protein